MNKAHARLARNILNRANERSRHPKGREAKAEKAKAKALPILDASRQLKDREPIRVVGSSWDSISRGITVNEYVGDGFTVRGKKGNGARPNGRRPSAEKL